MFTESAEFELGQECAEVAVLTPESDEFEAAGTDGEDPGAWGTGGKNTWDGSTLRTRAEGRNRRDDDDDEDFDEFDDDDDDDVDVDEDADFDDDLDDDFDDEFEYEDDDD